MKTLKPTKIDGKKLLVEIATFESLLASKVDLSESVDIAPFFKNNENFSAFLGLFTLDTGVPDRIAHEFDVSGDFRCDLVVGDSTRKNYCFIEFEDATKDSIFKTTKKATSEWGVRFEHGFSQIVDWFYRLDDEKNTGKWASLLGAAHVNYSGMVILGRDSYLTPDEESRLRWRSERLMVNSKPVLCRTFDQLLRDVKEKLAYMKAASV